MKKEYDLIIVGSGLYGCVTAYLAHQVGWRCLVIEKRSFVGGNIRDEVREGINVHLYGPHVFHTRYQEVWDFANLFTRFNHFRYCPLARYGGKMYNLPFNMHTFYQLYGTQTPEEAALRLRQEQGIYPHPRNLEEKAISMVGRTMYETLIKGYTEKQWGRKTTELPPFIIERLPLRFTFDNNYFNDPYQGVPMAGYSPWVDKMLEGTEVRLNTDFLADKDYWMKKAGHILYTGAIDAFFDYRLGALEYRSLTFEHVFFERPTYKASQSSTKRTAGYLIPEASNTSISPSARNRSPSSHTSFHKHGTKAGNLSTRSMTKETIHFTGNTKNWHNGNAPTLHSEDG